MMKTTFDFQKRTLLVSFFLVILFSHLWNNSNFIDELLKKRELMISYVILMKLNLHKSALLDAAEWIRSGSGVDYASGMASNYFNGYIRLQLPYKGDAKKGIIERCEEYEGKHGVTFAAKKLFILIPQSMHIEPAFQSKLLNRALSLETVVRHRAGVERPFKNDVYSIIAERVLILDEDGTKIKVKQKYYIALEGATPMLSFYDSCESNVTSSDLMKKMKREILLQFYKSIKKYCLECPETQNEVDFIYYNDCEPDRSRKDIGEVVRKYLEDKVINSN
ncbi:stimulator of interferon genes protein homolog [Condylostylus longicornis]|uniref:stimulator of interferon genes protein homolog n=1 Tax=Condylostylus longicornis TaxID=2530218 RepID=UPI00244DEA60|nr:stimulator of interferon genes protein homolog [Condylostylus longicornis]XP_055390371.1 stimulator of interferon genes protein homolog [Condylostylus longicornis]XP_055390372.1 stimulator of interferon genes protein homolog [Condylostylus longicornis]XP_055390373.1 stimulator of interferon genes protein homolog [Condylostylus longicornis]XP_055390374.1 stimulator of interferon genes protein homolog [Condylostylus longicornis]